MAQKTWAALSCTHKPISDEAYCKWVIKQIKSIQPDILIHLGDLFDIQCLSRFAKAGALKLSDEYAAGGGFLQELREAAPKTKRVFLMGNHEGRIFKEEHGSTSDLLDLRKHIEELKAWKVIPYIYQPEYTFRVGQITFAHGFSTSSGAMKREVLNLAIPNGLYVHGHLHRGCGPEQIMAGQLALPYWRADAGCGIGSTMSSYFSQWDTSRWSRGFLHGTVDTKLHADSRQHWTADFKEHSRFW